MPVVKPGDVYTSTGSLVGNFSYVTNSTVLASWTDPSLHSDPFEVFSKVGRVEWIIFSNWVNSLYAFNGPAVGHISYNYPNCTLGVPCSKAVQVQIQEWSINQQNDPNAPFDCSAYVLLTTVTSSVPGQNANLNVLPDGTQQM